MGRYLLACFSLTLLAGTVAACINDVELPQYEREFRSQYQIPAAPSAVPTPQSYTHTTTGLFIGGGVMLVAAVAFATSGVRVRNSTPRSPE
jgi:hypothetical protein